MSQSGKMINGDFPPSSKVTGLIPEAQVSKIYRHKKSLANLNNFQTNTQSLYIYLKLNVCHTFRPVSTPPVKETFEISGCLHNKAPVSASPLTTFKAPAGAPASLNISANIQVVIGADEEGLNTIVLPPAKPGATFHVAPRKGKFHDPIARKLFEYSCK